MGLLILRGSCPVRVIVIWADGVDVLVGRVSTSCHDIQFYVGNTLLQLFILLNVLCCRHIYFKMNYISFFMLAYFSSKIYDSVSPPCVGVKGSMQLNRKSYFDECEKKYKSW